MPKFCIAENKMRLNIISMIIKRYQFTSQSSSFVVIFIYMYMYKLPWSSFVPEKAVNSSKAYSFISDGETLSNVLLLFYS